jgi:hypothetical protein
MWSFLKWLAAFFCLLVIAAAGVFMVSRSQGVTPGREDAIALLESPMEMPGRNAFAAVWLLGYDVPEGEIEPVAAEDVARFASRPFPGEIADGEATEGMAFESAAGERHGVVVPGPDDEPALCSLGEPDCLATVRADPDGYAQKMAPLQQLLGQADALAAYGHYADGFPPRVDTPFPRHLGIALRASLTRSAVSFAQGDRDAGLTGVCRVAATLRPWVPHSDSLVASMVALRAVDGASALFADMLAELPVRAAVPEICTAAFAAPVPEEAMLCDPMKGEFRLQRIYAEDPALLGADVNPWWSRPLRPLLYDAEATQGRQAEHLAAGCTEAARQAVIADRPHRPVGKSGAYEFDCLANVFGCVLTSIAAPAYTDYHRRAQDHGMRLKVMATLLWLHKTGDDGRPLRTRLAVRPAATRSPARNIEVVDSGRSLAIELYDDDRGAQWQVPVPGSRWQGDRVDRVQDEDAAADRR